MLSNDVFERNVALSRPAVFSGAGTIHRDHAVQLIGHLHAGEQLLAGLRVTYQHRKVQRQTRNVGEGCAGSTASGVRIGKMSCMNS